MRTTSITLLPLLLHLQVSLESDANDTIVIPPLSPTTTSTPPRTSSREPMHGVDFVGPLWLPRTFRITCCAGGTPTPENPSMTRNWTQTALNFATDDTQPQASQCRTFEGNYLLAAAALFNFNGFAGYGVICKCPQTSGTHLDRSCRPLPPCQHGGYRSFSLNLRCACPEPYFGELCEKSCDQGQKIKGVDGRDYCSCVPFYQGEECRDMVCLNGGVEMKRRCQCPPNFLGYHCEIDANRTAQQQPGSGQRFRQFDNDAQTNDIFTRDVSGTIFSLIMIVVLVVSMYLLMKHRMQHRFTGHARRDLMAHPQFARRGDLVSPEDLRQVPFRIHAIDGPPPYVAQSSRGRGRLNEVLPPLPSYEDATKLPPLRPTVEAADAGSTPASDAGSAASSSSADPPCSSREPPVFTVEGSPKIIRSQARRSI